jgi:CBS domain-containing protein
MRTMSEKGIQRIPVMNEGSLMGIISREDLVRAIELCTS